MDILAYRIFLTIEKYRRMVKNGFGFAVRDESALSPVVSKCFSFIRDYRFPAVTDTFSA